MLNSVGIQAAAVAELVSAGRVMLRLEKGAPDKSWTDRVWARVIDAAPPGDPILDVVLAELIYLDGQSEPINLAGRALEKLFGQHARSWELVPRQRVRKGILREERTKVWGMLPVTRFPVVATAKQDDLRRTVSAARRSTSRFPDSLAALICIARSCCTLDRALTDDLRPSQRRSVIERAERNKLGRLLARMIDVATYEHPESQHSGLLAS